MSEPVSRKKYWFLKTELAVLVCLVCFCAVKSGTNDIDSIEAVVPKQPVKIEPDNEAIASYKRSIDTIPDNKQAHDQIARLRSSGYTPEAWLNEQFDAGRQQIQERFTLQWNEINRRASSLGPERHQQMLTELHGKGKAEMLRFNQEAQRNLAQLKQIDQLATQGAISNPEEVKWRIVLGPEIESAMFPSRIAQSRAIRPTVTGED